MQGRRALAAPGGVLVSECWLTLLAPSVIPPLCNQLEHRDATDRHDSLGKRGLLLLVCPLEQSASCSMLAEACEEDADRALVRGWSGLGERGEVAVGGADEALIVADEATSLNDV